MEDKERNSITARLDNVRCSLPEGVTLVAISKYHPVEAIREAYDAGQRRFGENHVMEMVAKAEALPKDIEWHFTGHVQTNKIKYMAPFVHTIQGVDSFRALAAISRHAERCGRVINCLLELHVAHEDSKYGLHSADLFDLLAHELVRHRIAVLLEHDVEVQVHGAPVHP